MKSKEDIMQMVGSDVGKTVFELIERNQSRLPVVAVISLVEYYLGRLCCEAQLTEEDFISFKEEAVIPSLNKGFEEGNKTTEYERRDL